MKKLQKRVRVEFAELQGKTITAFDLDLQIERLSIACVDGSVYEMYHDQDCCEQVWLDDIAGDIESILNSPIMLAEEVSNSENPRPAYAYLPDEDHTIYQWTFYKLVTMEGSITLRWYGESNGYYAMDAQLYRTKASQNKIEYIVTMHRGIRWEGSNYVLTDKPVRIEVERKNSTERYPYKAKYERWLEQLANKTVLDTQRNKYTPR